MRSLHTTVILILVLQAFQFTNPQKEKQTTQNTDPNSIIAQFGQQSPRVIQLKEGTAKDIRGKVLANRYLLFVASESNFCPTSCSCATGNCEGKGGCKDKFCYNGFIIKTDATGGYRIPLPPSNYTIYVDAITPETRIGHVEIAPNKFDLRQ